MSDLVQTLRDMGYPCCEEAAARIERLEKALRDVHAAAGNNHLIANIARAALEGK